LPTGVLPDNVSAMSTLTKTPARKPAARKSAVVKARPFKKFLAPTAVIEAGKQVRLNPDYDFTQPTYVLGT